MFYALWDFAASCPSLGRGFGIAAGARESHRLHWRHQRPKTMLWDLVSWQASHKEFSGSLQALRNFWSKENPEIFPYISIIPTILAAFPAVTLTQRVTSCTALIFDKLIIYATPCCSCSQRCCRMSGYFRWVRKIQCFTIPA